MFTAALIIYVILAILLGPLWPLEMFAKGGILGKLLAVAWFALFIAGLSA